MFTEERHKKILTLLKEKKSITVNELTKLLNFSPATIRSDLNYLDSEGLLTRTHGGATYIKPPKNNKVYESFDTRQERNHDEKVEIAHKALQFIQPDSCIVLDASSTTYELAKLLNETNVRLMIITNGLRIANLLKNNQQITTILIGGVIRGNSNAVEGVLGTDILDKINIDAAFLSSHAFSLKDGLTDFNLYEVELKRQIVSSVEQIYVLADHTKLDKTSIASFALPENIDAFITNVVEDKKELLEEYKQAGINII